VTDSFCTPKYVIFAYSIVILVIDLVAVALVNFVFAQEKRYILNSKATLDCSSMNVPLDL
jgi:hypothetical protein